MLPALVLITFWIWSCVFLPGANLELWSYYLCLLHSWDYSSHHRVVAYSLRWGGLTYFLHGLALNWHILYLYLPRIWDYMHVPPFLFWHISLLLSSSTMFLSSIDKI
jgi:hypothetical protein